MEEVAKAIGMDQRIGSKFLKASVGKKNKVFKLSVLVHVERDEHIKCCLLLRFWGKLFPEGRAEFGVPV